MTVREAERDAARLLDVAWWTTPEKDAPVPVEPVELALGLGIKVREVLLPPDESGNIVIPSDDAVVISINQLDSRNRRRFTCAHEIAHYIRRGQRSMPTKTYVDYRATLAGMGIDSEEIYANQFAAALLMPAHLVRKARRAGQTVEAMARKFGTSEQAMELRLRNLHLT